MFTDMVGYTALFQLDEHVGVAKRVRVHATQSNGTTTIYGGTIVPRLGDGTMSMFESAHALWRPPSPCSGSSRARTSTCESGSTWAR